MTATCFIVPLSLNTTRSASATVVDEAAVSPSMMLSSAAVEVTPSRMLSSAAVEVTPSRIFSSAAVEVIAVPLKLIASKYAVPSMYRSLNSLLLEPRSMSLSVVGSITPSLTTNCSTDELDTSTENSI